MVLKAGNILINSIADTSCPICLTTQCRAYYQDKRDYLFCPICSLVFVPKHQLLSANQEKAVYDLHENSIVDKGYQRFLERLSIPLCKRLKPNSLGLDFGSGPTPTLSFMLENAGHTVNIYDPFYAPNNSVFDHKYDFIVATEVVEHLHHPGDELDLLWSCLKPGGTLGIMTKRVIDQQAFSNWHYKNDQTHVCFFSLETFQWLGKRWGAQLSAPENDVVFFQKV